MSENLNQSSNSITSTIKFLDGTQISGSAGLTYEGGDLWVWPSEHMEFSEIISIFGDRNKTQTIIVKYTEHYETIFEGYSKLTAIQVNSIGDIAIRLNRP